MAVKQKGQSLVAVVASSAAFLGAAYLTRGRTIKKKITAAMFRKLMIVKINTP